jgi:hypothetical protein
LLLFLKFAREGKSFFETREIFLSLTLSTKTVIPFLLTELTAAATGVKQSADAVSQKKI